MKMKLLLTALGGALAVGASASYVRPSDAKDATHSGAVKIPAEKPASRPNEVADRLDSLLQPRFQERSEDFGLSRIYLPLRAHQYTKRDADGVHYSPLYALTGRTPKENKLLREANAANRGYVIGFLHCANTLAEPKGKKTAQTQQAAPAVTPKAFEPQAYFESLIIHEQDNADASLQDPAKMSKWQKENLAEINRVIKEIAPQARSGKKMAAQAGNWTLILRPVKASNASCLNCHGSAKVGDTLGVMAYAVRSEIVKP